MAHSELQALQQSMDVQARELAAAQETVASQAKEIKQLRRSDAAKHAAALLEKEKGRVLASMETGNEERINLDIQWAALAQQRVDLCAELEKSRWC